MRRSIKCTISNKVLEKNTKISVRWDKIIEITATK